MPRRARGLDPERRLTIALEGEAIRHGHERTPVTVAVQHLRQVAGGRDDLLAAAAGSVLGGYMGAPGWTDPARVYSAALLIMAGADPDVLLTHFDEARRRVAGPRYGTP